MTKILLAVFALNLLLSVGGLLVVVHGNPVGWLIHTLGSLNCILSGSIGSELARRNFRRAVRHLIAKLESNIRQ